MKYAIAKNTSASPKKVITSFIAFPLKLRIRIILYTFDILDFIDFTLDNKPVDSTSFVSEDPFQ